MLYLVLLDFIRALRNVHWQVAHWVFVFWIGMHEETAGVVYLCYTM